MQKSEDHAEAGRMKAERTASELPLKMEVHDPNGQLLEQFDGGQRDRRPVDLFFVRKVAIALLRLLVRVELLLKVN